MKRYQIALSSARGIEPQKYEIFNSKKEAEDYCTRLNLQLKDNPYAKWIVLEKETSDEKNKNKKK